METITLPTNQITLDNRLIHGRDKETIAKEIQDALVVLGYIRASLSMGQVSEIQGMTYPEANAWMVAQGIPTMRLTSEEVDQAAMNILNKV